MLRNLVYNFGKFCLFVYLILYYILCILKFGIISNKLLKSTEIRWFIPNQIKIVGEICNYLKLEL